MTNQISNETIAQACASLTISGYCIIKNVLETERTANFGKRIIEQAEAERATSLGFQYGIPPSVTVSING